MKTSFYNIKGEKAGTIEVPADIFDLPWNSDLVHQVAVSMQSNSRDLIAHTKGRSEVSGGGKKPWRQKGTGRARHGSRRSPIWRGGGITFGPTNAKNYRQKINKKMKQKAFFVALSKKLKDDEIVFLEEFSLTEPKTKEARSLLLNLENVDLLKGLTSKKKNAALITQVKKDEATEKGFKNFANIKLSELRNLNCLDLLAHKYVIISDPKKSLAHFKQRATALTGKDQTK